MERLLYADVGEGGMDMVEVVLASGLFTYRHLQFTGGIYEWSTASVGALGRKVVCEMGEVPAGLSAALKMSRVFEGWEWL